MSLPEMTPEQRAEAGGLGPRQREALAAHFAAA